MLFIGSTLKRQPLPPKPVSNEAASHDVSLAQEAESILGYSGLSKAVAGFPSSESFRRFLVECALAGLGIAPFSRRSVQRYKNRMLRRANRGSRGLWVAIIAASSVALVMIIQYPALADSTLGSAIGAFFGTLCILFGSVIGLFLAYERPTYVWKVTELRGYGLPVPKHALAIAIKVAKAMPNAQLLVDQLVEEKRSERVEDPFLMLRIGHDDFYLEVWDEPTFDGKRASA